MGSASSAVAVEPSSAFEFGLCYLEGNGSGARECRALLAAGWGTRFEDVAPVRRFPSFQGQRNFPGTWWAATSGELIGFESWLERDRIMLLDFSSQVTAFSSQPFWLTWLDEDRPRRHAPDLFARLSDGTGLVIDVRPDNRISPKDAETFALTAAACESVGWRYERVGEVATVLAANVRWLAGYRHPRCMNLPIASELLRAFSTPAGVAPGDRAGARRPDRRAADVVPPVVVRGADHRSGDCAVVGDGSRGAAHCPMSVSRPPELRIGDRIRLGGTEHTVLGLTGTAVRLLDPSDGAEASVMLTELFAAPGFSLATRAAVAPLASQQLLEGLPAETVEQARWWEDHIVEVLTGVPPQAGPGAVARPEYDPLIRTLRQRETAKAAELETLGRTVTLRTFQRLRYRYETGGLLGLIDGRTTRPPSVTGRVDERVVDAVRQAVREQTQASTGTVDRLRRRVEQILAGQDDGQDPVVMPSRATFYRLVQRVSAGKHTFGSARSRRSLAKQPDGPFGTVVALRPGEWMRIDSTPLNVRVVLDNGMVDRVELTWLIDMATRTISAAVLRPSTKSVDAALLLARSLTPEPMRPGWSEALRMSRSVLPHRRLTAIDERLEHAAARPVIVPETVVCDHGMVYMSQTFRNACRAMGINFQPSHEGSPWEKGSVETSFSGLDTLFAQHVAGYVGNSVENRGRGAEKTAVWSMIELQELLDEWIVVGFTDRRSLNTSSELRRFIDYMSATPDGCRAASPVGVVLRCRAIDVEAADGGPEGPAIGCGMCGQSIDWMGLRSGASCPSRSCQPPGSTRWASSCSRSGRVRLAKR
ncbi:TnsA-like heteromeric transposase endonuclease subunit [Catenulispora pinisilvae]|uniref:TnsA-like heteromeric transposase endonuclease subunit n=1 Tax=Catenulispora pinisilvae TaxID=2705253 RepID=UPI002B26C174|nr:TnsA-like heteromeric transposase endonuclease subunit [Catenulispora pinisilvae]